ncbi:MAG TPA: family 43 glycosylhydrolase, partial [Phycisphaerae bacterium]
MQIRTKSLVSWCVLAAAVAAGAAMGQAGPTGTAQEISRKMGMRNINVHDPSTIVQCGDEYYLYATQMPMFHSKDLVNWTRGPSPISGTLPWTVDAVGGRGNNGGGGFWAPDVIKVKDKYLLFVSISSFGVNTSGIGVMSSPTLDPNDPKYKWTDGGMVVRSQTKDDFNCIDPAALLDTDGKLWLSFG